MTPSFLSTLLRVSAKSTATPSAPGCSGGMLTTEITSELTLADADFVAAWKFEPTGGGGMAEWSWEDNAWVTSGCAVSPSGAAFPDGSPKLVPSAICGIVIRVTDPETLAASGVCLPYVAHGLIEYNMLPLVSGGVFVWFYGDVDASSELPWSAIGFVCGGDLTVEVLFLGKR